MKKITRRSFLAAMGYPSGLAAALPAAVDAVAEVAVELATEEAELPPQAVNAAGSAAAKPDGYPNTSMTLVVGFGAGGDTDLNNRLMAQYVEPLEPAM